MSQGAPTLERQASESMDIPERRVIVKDPSDLPASYCQTPGGTIFSTTPGGTRIIYDRHFLLQMKNSPLSRTPPVKLATIPDIMNEDVGVTRIEKPKTSTLANTSASIKDNHDASLDNSESGVFSMD